VEEGKIKVDEPAETYVPEVKPPVSNSRTRMSVLLSLAWRWSVPQESPMFNWFRSGSSYH